MNWLFDFFIFPLFYVFFFSLSAWKVAICKHEDWRCSNSLAPVTTSMHHEFITLCLYLYHFECKYFVSYKSFFFFFFVLDVRKHLQNCYDFLETRISSSTLLLHASYVSSESKLSPSLDDALLFGHIAEVLCMVMIHKKLYFYKLHWFLWLLYLYSQSFNKIFCPEFFIT